MLHISRNFLSIPVDHIYFDERKYKGRYEPKLSRYTHRLKPSRRLQRKQTVQIDLEQNIQSLLDKMSRETIDLLFNAEREHYKISTMTNPSDEDLLNFQRFFNQYAKFHQLEKVNRTKMNSLKLLRNQKSLVLTKVSNIFDETLCYRIYVVDKSFVLLKYAITEGPPNDEYSYKGNLVLCWENMKHFKSAGHKFYDFGGLNNELRCSDQFGGKEVTVYSGYIAKTFPLKSIAKWNRLWDKF